MKFGEKDNKDSESAEYDKDGKACKGGGYYKKGGELYPMKKSLTGDDLQNSLDKLESFAKADDGPSRKEELLAKAATDDGLSKGESEELFSLLGHGTKPAEEDSVADTIVKSLSENEPLSKALDVSSYLQENHDALCKSLGVVGEAIESADKRRHDFNLIMAKAVCDIGTLVKSMAETLGVVAGQPARAPKSAGVGGRAMEKSFSGTPPNGAEEMSKSQVLDAMEDMLHKSEGGRAAGEDLVLASAKFESTNQISPSMLTAVKNWQGNSSASH